MATADKVNSEMWIEVSLFAAFIVITKNRKRFSQTLDFYNYKGYVGTKVARHILSKNISSNKHINFYMFVLR